jgi:hypothetical protein
MLSKFPLAKTTCLTTKKREQNQMRRFRLNSHSFAGQSTPQHIFLLSLRKADSPAGHRDRAFFY